MSNQECPTCLEEYDTEERRVRVLNCGHVQCTSCLRVQLSNGKITCCICRVVHSYPDVNKIPINYIAENLMKEKSAPLVPKLHKGVCQDHGQHKLFICSSHNEWVCPTCCLYDHPREKCTIVPIKNQLENEKEIATSKISEDVKALSETESEVKQYNKQMDDEVKDEQKIINKMKVAMDFMKKAVEQKEQKIAHFNAKKLKIGELTEDIKKTKSNLEAIKTSVKASETFQELGKMKLDSAKIFKSYSNWKEESEQEKIDLHTDYAKLVEIKLSFKCFLTLKHKETILGKIIINFTDEYPRRSQHFLALACGVPRKEASYCGASFDHGVGLQGQAGERLWCTQYITAAGDRSNAKLFDVEPHPSTSRTWCEGDVIALGDSAGFIIVTRSGYSSAWPLLGRVSTGLTLLKQIASNPKGDAYIKEVTFSECGVAI